MSEVLRFDRPLLVLEAYDSTLARFERRIEDGSARPKPAVTNLRPARTKDFTPRPIIRVPLVHRA
jgi:hypothetical protein